MKLRIVVADESEAHLLAMDGPRSRLQRLSKLENEAARLHERDLESDRPGRSYDRMGVSRHSVGGEHNAQRHQLERFAKQVADEVERGRIEHAFDRLVLIAGPRMLGLLREALPEASRSAVVAEVAKDLVHGDAEAIRSHIPPEALLG
jgi:protein required for attachment to host cells